MNGVRRIFGGGSSSSNPATPEPEPAPPLPTTAPLAISTTTTPPLAFRKPKRSPDLNGSPSSSSASASNSPSARSRTSLPQSPGAGPSSPRVLPSSRVSQLSRKSTGTEWKRSSQMLNVRDDLLMSLLASEAIVDSRDYDILSSEDVEELKQELQVLSTRLAAMNKKLSLETKIRDAAAKLSKAKGAHENGGANGTAHPDAQLDAANKKVELAQKELWRVSERYNEIQRKLLEHRAGVLSRSVKTLERKTTAPPGTDDTTTSGSSTPNRSSQMSPITASSVTSVQTASSKGRFDGAHLFAGHSDAMPVSPRTKQTANANANANAELEEKLQAANAALEAAAAKHAEMEHDLEMLRMEKEQLEHSMGVELEGAQGTVVALQEQVARMEGMEVQLRELSGEQGAWAEERAELERLRQVAAAQNQQELDGRMRDAEERQRQVEAMQMEIGEREQQIDAMRQELGVVRQQLESGQREVEQLRAKLGVLQAQSGDTAAAMEDALAGEKNARQADLEQKEKELEEMRSMWESDKAAWEMERATLRHDMRETSDSLTKNVQAETSIHAQLDECTDLLSNLVQTFNIATVPGKTSAAALVTAVGAYLQVLKSQVESHHKASEDTYSRNSELETSIRDTTTKYNVVQEELQQTRKERDEAKAEIHQLEMQLQTQVATAAAAAEASKIPPVEYKGDAAQLAALLQPVWAVLPSADARASKLGMRAFRTGSPNGNASPVVSRSGPSLAELDVRSLKSLYDPKGYANATNAAGPFTVEAFAARVQALISDDRLLIERLIRFAQAHDMLKKNAERAQKLAQDSNAALETYQKQVKTLEDRNISLMTQQAEMQEELAWLHDQVDRLQHEKLDIETQAASQAETCAQLTEANATLSARALNMASEAASATDSVRKQLEAQLAEANTSLSKAREEMESVRQSQQTQQMALLEELNSVQTENTSLRAQLRAKK